MSGLYSAFIKNLIYFKFLEIHIIFKLDSKTQHRCSIAQDENKISNQMKIGKIKNILQLILVVKQHWKYNDLCK